MLVDANVLLYAVDSTSRDHAPAKRWLDDSLAGDQRIALPWASIGAFLRISTHPRVFRQPLTTEQAWGCVEAWTSSPVAWIPSPSARTLAILGGLITDHGLTGNLIPDAQLAALAIEHGIPVVTYDTDFERFSEVAAVRP